MASGHASRLAWALRDAERLMVGALRKDTSAEAREVERYPEEQIPARLASLIMPFVATDEGDTSSSAKAATKPQGF